MSKKIFDQIAEGLEEALAIARGESEPFRGSKGLAKAGREVTIDSPFRYRTSQTKAC
ncbi:MAG: hypothetical protein GY943_30515 [Chloroflexi bacterium]|nr:hypothetical protein [Chloroflexota bacterium]